MSPSQGRHLAGETPRLFQRHTTSFGIVTDSLSPLSSSALDAYLSRIGVDGRPDCDLDGLTLLHHAHLFNIPFDNLDVPLGITITLDPDDVFDKIVVRRRGGFCYEHNSLMASVLLTLGFDVAMLSSRVASGPRGWGPPFDHMTLRVHLDRPYLVDVGFGDSYRDPLPVGEWHEDSNGSTYQGLERDDGLVVQRRMEDRRSGHLYLTDPTPRRLAEFDPMCTFQQTSPDVWFTQTWVVTLPLRDGRMTLSPGSFKRTRAGIVQQTDIDSVEQTESILWNRFGMTEIRLPDTFPISRPKRPRT